MRKFALLLMACCLLIVQTWAQTRTITGKVTDAQGKPIPNASIRVKGTTLGTATGVNGSYSLSVPNQTRTLLVSSIGYSEKEVELGNNTSLTVSLLGSNQDINEVIVVAYGTVKRGDNTASSAQINAGDINKRSISNVTNAITGSAPGIQTTAASGQPGSGPTIRLRGFGSYSLGSDPLIVVDGVVYSGGLSNINPEDVESISTLKDAASGALYGSRGANGVIQITTKRGTKGRNSMGVKITQGYTERGVPEYDRVNASQYYPLMWESYRNSLVYGATPIPMATANNIASGLLPRFTTGANIGKQNYNNIAYSDIYQLLGNYNPFNVGSTAIVLPDGTLNPAARLKYADDLDWTAQSTRKGYRSSYDLNYSGTGEKADFFGSFGYIKEKGWANNADYDRFSGRVNVNVQPVKFFRTGFNLSGLLIKQNITPTGGIVNPFYFSRYVAPIYPVYQHDTTSGAYLLDANGQKQYDYGNLQGLGRIYNPGRHTIAENLWNRNGQNRYAVNARTFGEVIITRDLHLISNISLDVQDNYSDTYDNPIVGDGIPGGRASRTITRTTSYTWNQLANFSKKIGDHNISALAGHENYDYSYNYLTGSRITQVVDGITELANFSTVSGVSSYTDNARVESYLSKLTYDYQGKYLVSGSFRRDGNSKFSRAVRWDNFWSVGLAWRLEKESFLKNAAWIDLLKVRSSYGKIGNDQIGNYPYQAFYNLGRNNANEPGFYPSTLGNDSLTWETSKSFDLGVEFSFFKSRISGSVEYFHRKTDGLIFSVPQPLSNGGNLSGGLSVNTNIGDLWNRGVELQITGDIFRTRNFRWTATLNATKFNNRITKMPPTVPYIIDGTKRLEKDRSIYDFYLRDYYGVDPNDGAALWSNPIAYNATNCRILDNGKGGKDTVTTLFSNAQQVYTGETSIPKVYGSIGNTFSYKNFDLSFLLVYQLGGKVYDGVYASLMSAGTPGTTLHTDMLNRWQTVGQKTDVPRLDYSQRSTYNTQSDRFLIDASYIALNNVNFGYTIPGKFAGKISARSARVYVSGENLFLLSKRKGMNPATNFSGTTSDNFSLARIITAGINVNF